MIFFSEQSLRYAIGEYLEHYHSERIHQGLESQTIRSEFDLFPNHLSPDGRFLAVSRINIGVAMFVKAADGSWNFVQKIEPISDSGGFASRVALNKDYLVVADHSHRSGSSERFRGFVIWSPDAH